MGWTAANLAVVGAYLSWHSTRVAGPGATALLDSPWRCMVRTVQNLVMGLVPAGRNQIGDWLWSGQTMTRVVTLVVAAVVIGWIVFAAIRRDRITLFGWSWVILAFLPVCPLPWGERYAYLPAVGFAVVAVGLCRNLRGKRARALGAAVLAVFAVCSLLAAIQWTERVGRFTSGDQNSSSAAAQWKPAPNAVSSTLSPGFIRP